MSTATYICSAFIISFLLSRAFGLFAKKDRYPPGPKPHPFVGHLFQLPTVKLFKYFDKLSHQYGPIIRLSVVGEDIVVLTNPADAEELLVRRGQNYSSRKPLIFAGKYQSSNKRIVLLPYGDALRKQRAAFHQMMQSKAVGGYESIQELESVKLMCDILAQPTESLHHTTRFSASLIFTLNYGKRLGADDFKALETVMENFVKDATPGAHLVDTFPILDRLPDVLAPWRVEARKRNKIDMNLYSRLALEVKKTMDNGNIDLECFAARLWDQKEKMGFDLEELSYIVGTAFEAGTDTTSGTIHWFLMAMILFPETMRKAQAELDNVLGADGKVMPGFSHINDLPYCIALTKEVLRWGMVAPEGAPHYSEADDEYRGYKIKAHTMIFTCIWSMHRNEAEFPDAHNFKPERYMRTGTFTEHDSLVDGHYGFGFGRRKCPGQYLAAKSVWVGVTRLLWGFDISPEHDANGKPIPVDPDHCMSGITTRPEHFPVRLTSRSAGHAETIRKQWETLL